MDRVRAACVDIGSNTTRLLIAERNDGRLVELYQERVFTHIGRTLGPDRRIPDETVARVAGVVADQVATAARYGVTELSAVATAAVRVADNSAELIDAIVRRCGLRVRILSGQEEAHLAFLGAVATLEEPSGEPLGVIDVGGGSSELVVGRAPGEVRWWRSLEVGSGMLAHRFLTDDPPTADQLDAARAEVRDAFASISPPPVARSLAVGGSATSLARVTGSTLDAGALDRALSALLAAPSRQVAQRFAIDPARTRLLPAGLLILRAAVDVLRTPVTVGRGGIREGVLLQGLPELDA
jgi:exopolyphosphatase/guanosine-5'-triphosphate,3'-diphosphate pyrophosphatase